jgi:hypothetical protein
MSYLPQDYTCVLCSTVNTVLCFAVSYVRCCAKLCCAVLCCMSLHSFRNIQVFLHCYAKSQLLHPQAFAVEFYRATFEDLIRATAAQLFLQTTATYKYLQATVTFTFLQTTATVFSEQPKVLFSEQPRQ